MSRSELMRRWIPWFGFALLGAGACQVVVGETELTTVHCEDEGAVGPPACAQGEVCQGGVCVSETSAAGGGAGSGGEGGTGGETSGGTGGDPDAGDAADTSTDGTADASDDTSVPEVGPDVAGDAPVDSPPDVAPLLAVGEPCNEPDECQSRRCYQAPGASGKRCSSLCCSSFECAAGTVCLPFSGHNTCFPPGDVGLPNHGTGGQGQPCADGSACRSARCSGSGTCADVCCSSSNCNDNAACARQNYGGTVSWFCGPHTVGSADPHYTECSGNESCDGRNCYDYNLNVRCMGPCCSDADCKQSGLFDGYCDYLDDGGTVIRQCFPSTIVSAGAAKACCSDSNCASGQRCVPTQDDAWTTGTFPAIHAVWGMRCQ